MKVVKNTGWLIFEKLFSLSGGLLCNVFIARAFGPEDFGVFNYLLATASLFLPLMKFGMHSIITRELCNLPEMQSEILKSAFLIRLLASIFTLFIAIALINTGSWFDKEYTFLFIVLLISHIFIPFEVFNYWFESKVNSRPVVILRVLLSFSSIFAKVFVVWEYSSLELLILVVAAEFTLGYLAYFLCFIIKSGSIVGLVTSKVNFSYLMKLVRQSSLLIFSAIASVIYMKIDQVMLGSLSSHTEVAIYSVAVKFSEMAYFIPIAIVTSLFPGVLKLKNQKNPSIYKERVGQIMGGLFWLAFIGALICTVISETLIKYTYGIDYIQSAQILNIHIWGSIFVFVRAQLSKWILAEELYIFSILTQGAGALVNVILNSILIPEYGALGAAWATVISLSVACFWVLLLSKKTIELSFIMLRSPITFLCYCITLFRNKKFT